MISGYKDNNIRFEDLRVLLKKLGFNERINGGHHIYKKQGIPERIVIQKDNSKAKSYQVEQIRDLINKYGLKVK